MSTIDTRLQNLNIYEGTLQQIVDAGIGVNDIAFYGKSRLHVYKDMGIKPNINYDIPLEL